jgi:hypothetical protein
LRHEIGIADPQSSALFGTHSDVRAAPVFRMRRPDTGGPTASFADRFRRHARARTVVAARSA